MSEYTSTINFSLLLIFFTLPPNLFAEPSRSQKNPSFVGSDSCASCHIKESTEWQSSHHRHAMAEANKDTVLGDFNDAKFSYNGIETKFYRKGDDFFVYTDGLKGKLTEFKIDYTFGIYPLQQYLVKFPKGKLQALSIAWDSRPAKEGGQRWFHLYQNEKVDHKDVLHWTKHSQNWNYMCAECHSTDLKKNYDADTRSYNTTWSEISVGCEACHGPASHHLNWTKKQSEKTLNNKGFTFSLKNTPFQPRHDPVTLRTLPQIAPVDSAEQNTCARCHSRRSVISPEYKHGQDLMDTHFPALLSSDLYYADGQINDEVFEYGSFIQSKMHSSGVTCSHCHNPHSLKLRQPGNAVCAQCHQPAKYDSPKHHFHKENSSAADCKSCHMPSKVYMGVDVRHDHRMHIPAPLLASKIGAPDPCTTCHNNKSADWADAEIKKHYGKEKVTQNNSDLHDFALYFSEIRKGKVESLPKLIDLFSDSSAPDIVRATAIAEITPYLNKHIAVELSKQLNDKSAKVRAAAINALAEAPNNVKLQLITPLLKDKILAVRIEAAKTLVSVPKEEIPESILPHLESANKEYLDSQLINSDSPQANVNIGAYYAQQGLFTESEKAYRLAIDLEPDFIPAYINLADLYRQTDRDNEGIKILNEAIRRQPDNDHTHFALGMLKVRQKKKLEAIKHLKRATELAPDNHQYAYVYILGLIEVGKKDEASKILSVAKKRFPDSELISNLEGVIKG